MHVLHFVELVHMGCYIYVCVLWLRCFCVAVGVGSGGVWMQLFIRVVELCECGM